jgi:hypothetical protein
MNGSKRREFKVREEDTTEGGVATREPARFRSLSSRWNRLWIAPTGGSGGA